jgi:hypothetical protein
VPLATQIINLPEEMSVGVRKDFLSDYMAEFEKLLLHAMCAKSKISECKILRKHCVLRTDAIRLEWKISIQPDFPGFTFLSAKING